MATSDFFSYEKKESILIREFSKRRASSSTPLCRCTQRKAVAFCDWSLLLLHAASSSLALPHTFAALAPFHTFSLSLALSKGSILLVRAFPSSARENFPVESLRHAAPPRRWNRIAFFLLQRRRRRHSKTRTRAPMHSSWEEERERENLPNSPSFGCARAIVCNSARESNRNSPLSQLPYALLFPFAPGYPSSLPRPPRLQIAVVIADQWKRNQKIRSPHRGLCR